MTSRSLRTVVAVAAIGLFSSPVLLWALLTSASGEAASDKPPGEPAAARLEAVVQAPAPPQSEGGAHNAAAAHGRVAVEAGIESGVRGRLLQDGKPLVDAILRTGTGNATGVETTSHADGTFAMALPIGAHRLEVLGPTVARGFALGTVRLGFDNAVDLGDFEVPHGGACIGRVVDEREQPIAGALVLVSGKGLPAVGPEVADVTKVPHAVFARSGIDGRFRIDRLRQGKVQVKAEHPERFENSVDVQIEAGGCADGGDLVLSGFAPLRGIVVDGQGRPLPGACIVVGGARPYSQLQRRRTATAGADGSFTLPCFGKQSDLTVFADGCEPLATEIDNELGAVARLVLAPANEVRGRVVGGSGQPGTLRIECDEGDSRRWPGWVNAVRYSPSVVGADGSFCIPALPKGRWRIGASVPGVGVAPLRVIDVPTASIELELLANREVRVLVVDDLGAAVAGATVVRAPGTLTESGDATRFASSWFQWAGREERVTDGEGAATVRVPTTQPLLLAARSPRHLLAATVMPSDAASESVTLVVPRAAVLEGVVDDTRLGAHVHLTVDVEQAAGEKRHLASAAVDRSGRFRLAPLPAGPVRIAVVALDATHTPDDELALVAPLPWLGDGDGESAGTSRAVELVAGGMTEVTLATPVHGELTGRVTARGQPVANAIVFARPPAARQRPWERQRQDRHEYFPNCRTGGDGGFRFLVGGTGTYELLARHAQGGAWSPVHTVCVTEVAASTKADIVLAAAAIRGSFDVTTIEPKWRDSLSAQLYPLAEAAGDPFVHSDWSASQEWAMPKRPLGRTGSFAFECLPAGGWVLRIVDGFDHILLQRVVHTVGDEVLDFGRLDGRELVEASVATGAAKDIGAWLKQPAEGSEHGVFVATIGLDERFPLAGSVGTVRRGDSRFELGRVMPGRYRLHPFRVGARRIDWGVTGEPCGPPVDIEVAADGKVTPAVVWPDGVK